MSALTPHQTAEQFVTARREGRALDGYPGELPADLASAYAIQEAAINLWPDRVAGWKVGRIPLHLEQAAGIDRLAGPIFSQLIQEASNDDVHTLSVFQGGFGAVEAEYIVVISRDAPSDKTEWSLEESKDMIADVRIGIEIASSPLASINELGPAVVVSDFGNNHGLLVGPSVADWATRDPETLTNETWVEGQSVGTGGAFNLTGGFLRSAQFMLELAATLGRPLCKGDVIATGQTNGIHDVVPGQTSRVAFGPDGELSCKLEATAGSAASGQSI